MDTTVILEDARLRQRLGPSMEIAVEEVERLPRGGAGKLRAVISLAPDRSAATVPSNHSM